jgi:hypothetical protein
MARTRWHQLADAVGASNLRASDKSVFRYLLDKADFGTAELPPGFTPNQAKIARQTSISRRQVTYAIDHLRRHGWVTTSGTTAPGRTLGYSLGLGAECDCTGRVHDHRTVATGTGATAATGGGERVQPQTATGATFGRRTVATNGSNAAGHTVRQTRGTEREGVGRKPEPKPDVALCAVCKTAMDPVLPANGYSTHPMCDVLPGMESLARTRLSSRRQRDRMMP